ncbi:creatininase family protein [Paenibacillus nasutitermitis]|uniref:Creatininase n=1 Tax=Paenibacillus nasutitermitis TaxID=1652958 RepID=A0A916ZHL2_9BACL|nr:creatininase family protein [Paenibacillus nasutitermitis]GGD98386.1 creatininase [Paenibacillus nasutitermitis]
MILHNMTAPEVGNIDFEHTLVVIPVGSTEQHGPHLPTDTDTFIVDHLAKELERENSQTILLTPTMWLGHSPHHLDYGGTLSVYHPVYIQMLQSICQSYIGMGARKLWILNGHGGNSAPNQMVLQQLKNDFPDILIIAAEYWHVAAQEIASIRESDSGGLGHACELETSLYLYLDPSKVRLDLIADDGGQPAGGIWEFDMLKGNAAARVFNFKELTASGVFGKPSMASSEKGGRLFEAISGRLSQFAKSILQLGKESSI